MNELKYLERVLNSESWSATGGSWNRTLEKQFATKFGARYAIAMNSGTSTLHTALAASGVGPGDEVISPALTVFMDTAATLHAGATPVFSDVDERTFNIDPEDIERKITERTKAIIAVALYGLMPDLDAIMAIAERHNLIVIEDNAQAFNIDHKIKGHFASYSFETTKHLSCGEGGVLLTSDKLFAERARKFAGHGFKNLRADEGRVRLNDDLFQRPEYERHDMIGYNYRLSEFSAAVALAQLEKADELINMRKKSASEFLNAIAFCKYLIPQFVPEGYSHSYYTVAALYYGDREIDVNWKGFRKDYLAHGGDGIYGCWQVPYNEPAFTGEKGNCPVAEKLQPRLMQFKTNYRDTEIIAKKAEALYSTIMSYKRASGEAFEI